MPDVIDTLPAACALLGQLAATVPPWVGTGRNTAGGRIPDSELAGFVDVFDAEKAAARFLLEAVDWNVELLDRLAACADRAEDDIAMGIVGQAWCRADSAASDPHTPPEGGRHSPAAVLAYFALAGGLTDPESWRECDRTAALEVLPLVAAGMRSNPDAYPCQHPRDEVEAGLSLIMFEPSLPDRRHGVPDR